MKRILRWAFTAALLGAAPAIGGPGLNAIGCLGEANYMYAGDMGGSTTLPQIGFTLEYRTRLLSISNSPTIGYYYGRPVLEDWLGMEIGWDIAWARPALTGGFGAQTYSRKVFLSDGDEYRRQQEVRFPIGIGYRLWIFQSFYGEWHGRFFREGRGGVPWWKMEFGYKVI